MICKRYSDTAMSQMAAVGHLAMHVESCRTFI